MGADIHGVIEQKVGEKWIMINRLGYLDIGNGYKACMVTARNYEVFGALAGVRREGPDPKGLPHDASESAKLYSDEWGEDGHSHSYYLLGEALKILKKFLPKEKVYSPAVYWFGIDPERSMDHYRFVFWFDN